MGKHSSIDAPRVVSLVPPAGARPESHTATCSRSDDLHPWQCECRKREALERLFAAFERDDIEVAVDLLIEQLDARDGDTDIEPNGDELDGLPSEDDYFTHRDFLCSPGCPISDPGEEDDPAEDDDDDSSEEELGEITSSEWLAKCDGGYDRDQDDNGDLDLRPVADAALRKAHRDRIRRARCDRTSYGYRLREHDCEVRP